MSKKVKNNNFFALYCENFKSFLAKNMFLKQQFLTQSEIILNCRQSPYSQYINQFSKIYFQLQKCMFSPQILGITKMYVYPQNSCDFFKFVFCLARHSIFRSFLTSITQEKNINNLENCRILISLSNNKQNILKIQ